MTDSTHDVQGQIAELWIYPVKSCAGIAVQQARLSRHGLEWDRHWMVVEPNGEFLTQRSHPRMALIRPEITADSLLLHFAGQPSLQIPLLAQGAKCRARVWSDTVQAWDLGECAAPARAWLSQVLETDCQLVRFDPAQPREASEHWVGEDQAPVHFADGYPLLVLSEASLSALNERLAADGQAPVGMERFRPNIVLDGVDAHDEDRLALMHITTPEGEVQLKGVKPCTRCPIPNIDPVTAVVGTAVGDALQRYRVNPVLGGAVSFGMNAVMLRGLEHPLCVGQTVQADFRFD